MRDNENARINHEGWLDWCVVELGDTPEPNDIHTYPHDPTDRERAIEELNKEVK